MSIDRTLLGRDGGFDVLAEEDVAGLLVRGLRVFATSQTSGKLSVVTTYHYYIPITLKKPN